MNKFIKVSSAALTAASLCASASLAFAATASDGHTIGDGYTGHTTTSTASDGNTIGDQNGASHTTAGTTPSSTGKTAKASTTIPGTITDMSIGTDGSGTLTITTIAKGSSTSNTATTGTTGTTGQTKTETIAVASTTTVASQDGTVMTASQLHLGDKITISAQVNSDYTKISAVSIKDGSVFVTGRNKVTIDSIDTTANTINGNYSRMGKNYTVTINYSDSTAISQNGQTLAETDLKTGSSIVAKGLGRIDSSTGTQINIFDVSTITVK